MAGGRRKSGGRRQPTFDADSGAAPVRPKISIGKSKKKKISRKRSFGVGRFFYWSAVAALWLVIAGIGGAVWVGAHLPPIQSLEIPKRPPSIQITGINGKVLATRGDGGGEPMVLKELPAYLPKAFIAIEDRRFYDHVGVDPMGIGRAVVANVMHRGLAQDAGGGARHLARTQIH